MKLNNIKNIYNLGDVHLGIKSNSNEWFNIQNDYLTNHFIKSIDNNGFNEDTDILIQYGDWFHYREHTNNKIWNGSIEILSKLCSKFKRGVYIFLGNHDVYYKDNNKIHSLAGLDKMFDNLHIFVEPEILTINNKHNILILPWIGDSKKLNETVLQYVGKADYIMAHADIQNMRLNKYTVIEHGIETAALMKYKRVYSGHIHIRQEYKNALYIGTPYEMDRGDRGNVKGYYILDATGNELKETFVENNKSPKHIKLYDTDIMNMSIEELRSIINNNFVDVMIDFNAASSFPIAKLNDLLDPEDYRKIEYFTYNNDKTNITVDNNIDYDRYDIKDAFNDYMKDLSAPKDISDKMVEYFNDLLNKVNQKA